MPALPPLTPGRSALPAFLSVERSLAEALAESEARVRAVVEGAQEEARGIRAQGEARLKAVVLAAEADARREVEGRARDRVSEARVRVQRWIEAAEERLAQAVERAVDACIADGRAEDGP